MVVYRFALSPNYSLQQGDNFTFFTKDTVLLSFWVMPSPCCTNIVSSTTTPPKKLLSCLLSTFGGFRKGFSGYKVIYTSPPLSQVVLLVYYYTASRGSSKLCKVQGENAHKRDRSSFYTLKGLKNPASNFFLDVDRQRRVRRRQVVNTVM